MSPVLRWLPAGAPELAPTPDVAQARALIAAVSALHLADTRDRIVGLVDRLGDAIVERTCRPGHLTGSALVVQPSTRRALLLLHAKLGKWLQPGGHADGDANLVGVALREAVEETGIGELRILPRVADLDIHEVRPPREDPHLHLDVRFVVLAPVEATVAANHEARAHRWVALDELTRSRTDPGLARLARRGLAVLDAGSRGPGAGSVGSAS